MRVANEVVRVSGPYGSWGEVLMFESDSHEWTLEARRYKGFNRRVWRGTPSSGSLLGILSDGTGKRSFQAKVTGEIQNDDLAVFIFCWASLLKIVKRRWEMDFGPSQNYWAP
jgi:hypothetical protein